MSAPEPFSRNIYSIDAGEPLAEAARMMGQRHIGSLVVTESGKAVGLVTDRDLALHGLLCDEKPEEARVRDCTSRPLITLPVESDMPTMARTLKLNGVRRAVLVDEQGAPVGMLSADDLLAYLGREVAQLATAVQREFQEEAATRQSGSAVFGAE